ncbi:MAG: TlyA family RNA methyltransferase [Deltaproteobacteria bacterium]|nr:TlyA family RNA methyltransferase [Deltaproteobacteria bacterium]
MQDDRRAKNRLDLTLVARGLADTIEASRALIMAGKVLVNDQRRDKAGDLVAADATVRVKEASRFVSRGGEKLAAALADLQLTEVIRGLTVLDIGASTGGFTDCCLQHGAQHVVALDVGSNQLAWELRTNPRVTVLEQTDVRQFVPAEQPAIQFVVADVSFNSLARLAPAVVAAAPGGGVHFLLLVKPQFELARDLVPDGGIVNDPSLRQLAATQVSQAFAAVGLSQCKVIDCRLPGRAGNQELFFYGKS